MFYYLTLFQDVYSPLRIFRYITFRAIAGAGTSFLLVLLLAPAVIRALRRLQISQVERKEEAPPLYELHAQKEGTPTMGGLLIIAAVVVASLLWTRLSSPFLWIVLATLMAMGAIGFTDDYCKVKKKQSKGLSARAKILLQMLFAAVVTVILLLLPETAETMRHLMVPFFKEPVIHDMGILFTCLLTGLVLVGASNAVNLTDGLDGLAIGCSGSAALAYLVMAYVAGHVQFAEYLAVPYIPGTGELAVFCGCLLGASLGFLWHNCHPAAVFMGDTGSLALGGSIAMVAVLIKQELVLIIVGGVFVMEALSVMIQVVSFKLRGKRVFAMAPLHHHFELRNWSETQVTIRFWILSILLAILGVMTLKLR